MGSLGASGSGGLWGMGPFHRNIHRRRDKGSKPSNSSKENAGQATTGADSPYNFPLKESATAASLVLAGDTIAQVRQKWVKHKASVTSAEDFKTVTISAEKYARLTETVKLSTPVAFADIRTPSDQMGYGEDIISSLFSEHDWTRALRMTSYGFLLYGPGSYAWYRYLDHCMPKKNVTNLMTKVLLNQIVLGPIVIGVVFAWNNLWLGKLAELPNKYQKDALPTLFYGFRFWIPVSLLNFWAVPLQTRVAFMSMASVFWNFYLSSTMSR
ncbi:peroxisomal membrane 22 kDa family protein [Striga asiatica]|uniref:Peroxisomal membrane 22 kDa family protein n=1 Tax=Striga asiatica TaxID=4170 RepID=A0A5A7RH10_STRAF|nr:peroxisomal membrane 22 kDa family protein [Striga asiatica]